MLGIYLILFCITAFVTAVLLMRYTDKAKEIYRKDKDKYERYDNIETIGLLLEAASIMLVLVGIAIVNCNEFVLKEHIVSIVVIDMISWIISYILLAFLCKDWKTIRNIRACKEQLKEIEVQIKNICKMQGNITDSGMLTVNDRETQIKSLEDTKDLLRKAYGEINNGLNSLYLLGTFKSINEYNLTDETREDLQRQMDMFKASQEFKQLDIYLK